MWVSRNPGWNLVTQEEWRLWLLPKVGHAKQVVSLDTYSGVAYMFKYSCQIFFLFILSFWSNEHRLMRYLIFFFYHKASTENVKTLKKALITSWLHFSIVIIPKLFDAHMSSGKCLCKAWISNILPLAPSNSPFTTRWHCAILMSISSWNQQNRI